MRAWLSLGIVACGPGQGEVPTDPEPTDDPTSDTGTPADTGTTLTANTTPPELANVTAALHPTYQSIGIVQWDQPMTAQVHLEYSFDEGVWLSSPERTLGPGNHQELLLGVPYSETATFRVVATNAAGTATSPEATLFTARLPDGVEQPVVTVSDPSSWDPSTRWVMVSITSEDGWFGDPWFTLVLDRQGRVVWAHRSDSGRMTMHPQVSYAGDSFLIDQNSYWAQFDGGADSTVEETYIDGTIGRTWDTPGLHHPFTELPDGTLAYGAMEAPYVNEYLVLLHPDGSGETIFDCEAWLSSIGENGFCGSNTLRYDLASNTFLFSFYSFESILQLDASTGEVQKRFGHVDGAYAFDPPTSAFWWQHGGHFTPEGTLVTSTYVTESGVETVVREYEIDDASRTLREVWSFGVGDGVYGDQMGEAWILPSGNVLHNLGTTPRLREGLPDGTVVWDVQWTGHDIGRSTALSDLYAFAPPRP